MLKAFDCNVKGSTFPPTTIYHVTAGKAKYKFWMDMTDCYPDIKYTDITVCRGSDHPSLAVSANSNNTELVYEGRTMTEKQKKLARHALGLPNKKNTSYRNHFCVGIGEDGYAEWEAMVIQGDAVKRTGPHWGGDDMFYLTLKGALAVREPKEHISREDAVQVREMETV
jgi:hypothetical protein